MNSRVGSRGKVQGQIEDLLSGQMLDEIKGNPDFFRSLPPNVQATLANRLIPAAKPVDVDLEREALSLSELLSELPKGDSVGIERVLELSRERALNYRIESLEKELAIVGGSNKDERLIEIVQEIENLTCAFYEWVRNCKAFLKDVNGFDDIQKKFKEREDELRKYCESKKRHKRASKKS